MHKAQRHVNLHINNGMGKRNVFYDDSGKEIAVWVTQDDSLHIEIADTSIELSRTDAVLFILDLYRMKRRMVDEK